MLHMAPRSLPSHTIALRHRRTHGEYACKIHLLIAANVTIFLPQRMVTASADLYPLLQRLKVDKLAVPNYVHQDAVLQVSHAWLRRRRLPCVARPMEMLRTALALVTGPSYLSYVLQSCGMYAYRRREHGRSVLAAALLSRARTSIQVCIPSDLAQRGATAWLVRTFLLDIQRCPRRVCLKF